MAVILEFPRRSETSFNALDTLLDRGLITSAHHWCGVHLCWLHQIRMGAGGENAEWREARLLELCKAQNLLFASGHLTIILNLCINDSVDYRQSEKLRDGLGLLAGEWDIQEATA